MLTWSQTNANERYWSVNKTSLKKQKKKAQLFICKGEKIANAGYLENIANFCESYNLH